MRGWILLKEPMAESLPYGTRRLIEAGAQRGLEICVLKPDQFELVVTRDDRRSICVDHAEVELPDFLLPRMGAATTYFALAVIRQLERLGVHTFNTSVGIETVKDKLYSQQILAQSNLPVPKTMLAKFPVDVDLVERVIGFPVVVKAIHGSQGSGVFLCDGRQNLQDLMEMIRVTQANANIIFQEFIECSRGRDVRVMVVGGRVVAAMERRATGDNFKANYHQGGVVLPFPITKEVEWLALESTRLLNLDIAGIDLLFDGEHFKVCEANSAPGFEGLERCSPVSIADEILDFVSVRIGCFDQLKPDLEQPKERPWQVSSLLQL
ncbi:MAG: RimK family alpha-L-glutamate ligase [Candidatus Melainabacteria bacterium]|nr:RimK family alpha-L-glutamate ligase [Candidatus Melainabacteria bacterium]